MYNAEIITHLAKFIGGDDASREWLQKNNFPELILLAYAIDGNDPALIELTKQKHVDLVTFAHAVLDDKRAFNWLAQNKKFLLAATVRVSYGDKGAEAWLARNNYHHFIELGRAIKKNEEEQAPDDIFGLMKKFINIFRNPYRR